MKNSRLKFSFTILTSFLTVASLFFMIGGLYGQLLLPLFRWELASFFPAYRVMHLGLAGQGTEIFFTLKSVLPVPCVIGTTILPAGTMLTGSTLLGHALQHPVILLSMSVVAWLPQKKNGRRLLISSLLLLLAIELLDVPLVLIGSMENLLFEQFAPTGVSSSFIIYWMNFLNQGGRLAISITGGIFAILFGLNANSVLEQPPAGNEGSGVLQLAANNPGSLQTGKGK